MISLGKVGLEASVDSLNSAPLNVKARQQSLSSADPNYPSLIITTY